MLIGFQVPPGFCSQEGAKTQKLLAMKRQTPDSFCWWALDHMPFPNYKVFWEKWPLAKWPYLQIKCSECTRRESRCSWVKRQETTHLLCESSCDENSLIIKAVNFLCTKFWNGICPLGNLLVLQNLTSHIEESVTLFAWNRF